MKSSQNRRNRGGAKKVSSTNTGATNSNQRQLLLLHGNRQTGQLLSGRLEKLKKRLRNEQGLTVVAPDAPFAIQELQEDGSESLLRTWWERVDNDYQGLEQTLDLLSDPTWNNENTVGMMGFSQGARLVYLLSLLHSSDPAKWFPNLKFVILVSGYDAPLPERFEATYFPLGKPPEVISIPSLHVWGLKDPLIPPEDSEAVTTPYQSFQTHIHPGKHFVPTKAPDIQAYLDFVGKIMGSKTTDPPSKQSKGTSNPTESSGPAIVQAPPQPVTSTPKQTQVPDEESAAMQQEEIQALEAIYPDEIAMKSNRKMNADGEEVFDYPIVYDMKLLPADEDVDLKTTNWPPHPLTLRIQYPHNYPLEAIPSFQVQHDNNNFEFPSSRTVSMMNILADSATMELGMPSVLSCLYAVRDYLDSEPTDTVVNPMLSGQDQKEEPADSSEPAIEAETEDAEGSPLLRPSSAETVHKCNLEGLDIAEKLLKRAEWNNPSTDSGATGATSTNKKGGGSFWTYTIGLVGKPSAGKSTFFNAATAFSRQRGGEEEWGGASMAAHPFTTIDPNVGYCLIPAPLGACPEDDMADPASYGSTHGRDPQGRRFLPVLLKDVAGLVPGAYQGRGRGNQFLNDLTDATVLIHVVDASGTADAQGNKTVAGDDACDYTNPLDDLAWIRNELIEWVYSNVTAKWDTIKRKGRSKLSGMFSGYGQREMVTQSIFSALEKFLEEEYERDRALERIAEWDQGDAHRLVSAFLGVRFPMALALNKCDLPSSQDYLQSIQESLPIHGAHTGTPMTARREMTFVRNQLKAPDKEDANEQASAPTQVWKCLTSAMMLRQPVLVFPVSDFATYAPLAGLNTDAAENASLPSDGMIRCFTTAGGHAPTCWNDDQQGYILPSKDKSSQHKLRDVLLMKPGSTVEDVFLLLKKLGGLSGEFVRAEAAGSIGDKPKPIPKLEVMGKRNRIIKIMSNKRSAWQS